MLADGGHVGVVFNVDGFRLDSQAARELVAQRVAVEWAQVGGGEDQSLLAVEQTGHPQAQSALRAHVASQRDDALDHRFGTLVEPGRDFTPRENLAVVVHRTALDGGAADVDPYE